MDFTYPFAFVEGMVLSLVASLISALIMKRIPRNYARIFVLVVAGLVLATSVNWRVLGSLPPTLLILDFAMIVSATALGCLVGAIPARLWLRVRRAHNSN